MKKKEIVNRFLTVLVLFIVGGGFFFLNKGIYGFFIDIKTKIDWSIIYQSFGAMFTITGIVYLVISSYRILFELKLGN